MAPPYQNTDIRSSSKEMLLGIKLRLQGKTNFLENGRFVTGPAEAITIIVLGLDELFRRRKRHKKRFENNQNNTVFALRSPLKPFLSALSSRARNVYFPTSEEAPLFPQQAQVLFDPRINEKKSY